MQIIPVIDLLNGHAVHAVRGDRHNYHPLQSGLCGSSEPLQVLAALLRLYPFDCLYIADIDAIEQRGSHQDLILQIRHHYPMLDVWLDCGLTTMQQATSWQQAGVRLIIGSESMTDLAHYLLLKQALVGQHLLSLDFSAKGFRGPAAILEAPACWPEHIIAMTLAQVGSHSGPDYARLEKLLPVSGHKLYAAGGIRGVDDLLRLQSMGVSGALVASALHAGRLDGEALHQIMRC